MKNISTSINSPRWMITLFTVQFFTWVGFFSLWIYATPIFAKYIFQATETESEQYEKAVQWVGISFAFYSLLAASFVFLIPKLLRKLSLPNLYSLGLFLGGIGMISVYFISKPFQVFLPFLLIGMAWSVIITLPYQIVGDLSNEEGMTRNLAIFNFSVVIPQVTSAFLLSYLTHRFFYGETIITLVFGGSCLIIASIICKFFVIHQKITD